MRHDPGSFGPMAALDLRCVRDRSRLLHTCDGVLENDKLAPGFLRPLPRQDPRPRWSYDQEAVSSFAGLRVRFNELNLGNRAHPHSRQLSLASSSIE